MDTRVASAWWEATGEHKTTKTQRREPCTVVTAEQRRVTRQRGASAGVCAVQPRGTLTRQALGGCTAHAEAMVKETSSTRHR